MQAAAVTYSRTSSSTPPLMTVRLQTAEMAGSLENSQRGDDSWWW